MFIPYGYAASSTHHAYTDNSDNCWKDSAWFYFGMCQACFLVGGMIAIPIVWSNANTLTASTVTAVLGTCWLLACGCTCYHIRRYYEKDNAETKSLTKEQHGLSIKTTEHNGDITGSRTRYFSV